MRKLLILVSLLVCGCSELFECKETRYPNQGELSWFPDESDKTSFISSLNNDTLTYVCSIAEFDKEGSICEPTYGYHHLELISSVDRFTIGNIIYRSILKKTEGLRLDFNFGVENVNPEIPVVGTYQDMGCINVTDEKPCNNERYGNSFFYHATKQLNGTTYEGVIEMNDYEPNRIPEVDISRFYVNQKGILRIEFYSGEVWDRVF